MRSSWYPLNRGAALLVALFFSSGFSSYATPRLTAISEGSGQVRLTWSSTAGREYRLRAKSTLDGVWSDYLTPPLPIVANGPQLSYLIPVTGEARFFQVVESEVAVPTLPDPVVLARQIIESVTPAAVVQATSATLSAGGIAVGDVNRTDHVACDPAASWFVDPQILFNMATEAHNRPVSGRFTLADLGQLWSDMGFPFLGSGTPGDQLLRFLQLWLEDAVAAPPSTLNYTPRFIAAMAAYQQPAVVLSDPRLRPDEVRLSLLEVDLLMAAFDRLFQPSPTPGGASSGSASLKKQSVTVSSGEGMCTEIRKFYGTIGSKFLQKSLSYTKGQLTDKALGAIGITQGEIEQFKVYEKYFKALDMAMKIVKLTQLYASTEVTLKVEGADPVHKPHKGNSRVLQTISATAGIPEADWENYQKEHTSQAFKDVTDCLGFAGMPLPLDLSEIAKKVDSWRVAWEVVSGAPKHVLIPSDVNNFNAPSNGHPFGMKLARSGAASAKATLKMDVKEETTMAAWFMGPLKKSPVVVKAKVFTAEPPSPALLIKTISLLGTTSALLDLSVGWVQTAFPPASTTRFQVEYHDLPIALDARLDLDMRFHYTHFDDEPANQEVSARGNWHARLALQTTKLQSGVELASYTGEGTFNYASATAKELIPEDDCTTTFSAVPISGILEAIVGPARNQRGQLLLEKPEVIAFAVASENNAPRELETITIRCPDGTKTFTLPPQGRIAAAAIDALNLMEVGVLLENGELPGNPLSTWVGHPDGSISRTFTGSKRISVVLNDGVTAVIDVLSQLNELRLIPTYAPAQ